MFSNRYNLPTIIYNISLHAGGCSNCLTEFDIFVQTSSVDNAQTAGSHDVEISFVGGEKQKFSLTNIPKKSQAKLYSFALTDCFTIFDPTNITVIAVNTDGWNIETIVTTFTDDKGRTYSGSINRKVNRWVDHKNRPEQERFVLALKNHG